MAVWVENLHPRAPKGSPTGGQWVEAGDNATGGWVLDGDDLFTQRKYPYPKGGVIEVEGDPLTNQQQSAISGYLAYGSDIDDVLENYQGAQSFKMLTDELDTALRPLAANIALYRKINGSEGLLRALQPGDFVSRASYSGASAESFDGPQIRILARVGANVIPLPTGNEVLLPRDAQLKFMGEDPNDKAYVFLYEGFTEQAVVEKWAPAFKWNDAEPAFDPDVVEVGGDSWSNTTAKRLEAEYQRSKYALERIVKAGVGSDVGGEPAEPTNWDSLSSKDQDKIKEEYFDKYKDSEYEQQLEYWQENDAPDAARDQVANDFNDGEETEWAENVVKEWMDNREKDGEPVPYALDDIIGSMNLTAPTYSHKLFVNFNNSVLEHPTNLVEEQQLLPGFEEIPAHKALSAAMRVEIIDTVTKAYEDQVTKVLDDLEPPNYLQENANDSLSESWNTMGDDEKFEWAKNHTSILEDYESEGGDVLAIPDEFDPLDANHSLNDYKKTQALAKYLSLQRTKQIFKDRNLDVPDDEAIATADNELWSGWKSASKSFEGLLLQQATADELGGRHRGLTTEDYQYSNYGDREKIIKQANNSYSEVNGYQGVKAMVRAKWETTQYMLDKAGIKNLTVYRGMAVKLSGTEKKETFVEPSYGKSYVRLSDVQLKRNGAWSTSTDRSIANNWSGGNGTKITVRIQTPRTAVLSVPAYGVNVHGEREVVLAGTAYKSWDAWLGSAPTTTTVSFGEVVAQPEQQKIAA